jgi:miniconductance mechanosensitive channel
LCVFVVRSLLRTGKEYLKLYERFKDKPLDSYLQIFMIFSWGVGLFFIINLITGYSTASVASFGAVSAVVLLIFKDTILGFVASIQISVNDIIRIGDWITFSKYGADGTVTEINLATVTVQNFDNSFTTIPTYSLIADSFQNWRGMQESDGRRIKRSIFIKQNSVKFLDKDDIEKLKGIELVHQYLDVRENDNSLFNIDTEVNKYLLVNGKNQTNLGVFREYINAILIDNPLINKDLYLMVRYLPTTDKGIPVEIYCFCHDKKWENYEKIQADILDQVLGAVPYFELE